MNFNPIQKCRLCLAEREWSDLRDGVCWDCRIALESGTPAEHPEESAPALHGRCCLLRSSHETPAGADIPSRPAA